MLTIPGGEDSMTKNRLKKLRGLIKEAEHLQAEYEDMMCFPKTFVQDSVKDYSTGYPHNIVIQGYGSADFAALRQKLYDKLSRIQRERQVLEDWLDSVEDPELRDILRLQYINGLTQEQIADELGYSVRTVKRRLSEFWKGVL